MKDDYLWDRSGEPDPEVERLERLLSRYRHEAPFNLGGRKSRRWWLAAAAAVLLVVAGAALALTVRFRWKSGMAWDIVSVNGTATLDGKRISEHDHLGEEEELRTGPDSRVTVRVARVGEVEIGPSTTLRIVSTSTRRHRIALDRGTISARVWAPPFIFSVDTPAGLASDIGCAFNIGFAEGAGHLHVTSGWVDFDGDIRSSLVPAGAIAELRQLGPGTPYYTDAPAEFRAALRDYDFNDDREALSTILATARPRDAMTLLHLLERAEEGDRAPLFDRLSVLAPPPAGVTRAGILRRDLKMLDSWRRALGLGGVKKWWVYWRDALPR